MTDKQPYTYTVLRYFHDVMTGECVNVGVIVHAPNFSFLNGKIRGTIGRIKDIFPDLDNKAFKSAIWGVRRSIARLAKDQSDRLLFSPKCDAVALARAVLPADDSSLQWSPVGTGLTDNPQATLDRLFNRFVARYDVRHKGHRTDDEVWRPVGQKLEERHLASRLQETVIHGRSDDITFEHAWKNGIWHCYEPVSLDLADADGIKQKARGWLGHLTAVVDGAEKFKTRFLVGVPSDKSLLTAYESAVQILRKGPNKPEVYEESEIDLFVARIEDEIAAHQDRS